MYRSFKLKTITYNNTMELSLRYYLTEADAIHDQLFKFGVTLSIEDLTKKTETLHKHIRTIQSVAKRLADISNIVNRMISFKKIKNNNKYVDPYPTENDHAVLRAVCPIDSEQKSVTKENNLPVIAVDRLSDIPISKLYYVRSHKQYAININGIIIKGSLGNIVEYKTLHSARCEYSVNCKSFKNNTECPYYHDPEDYLKLGKEVPETTRNFTVGSWMYSKNRRPKKYFTRHVGSLDTLDFDIKQLKRIPFREEISTRESQLIHDLLIYMILHKHGLLERYPHWMNE